MNLMVTTNQKPPMDIQKIKRKESKHNTKGIHQTTRGKKPREEDRNIEELQKQPEKVNKMAVSTYLSITTLNANGLNAPVKRHRVGNG